MLRTLTSAVCTIAVCALATGAAFGAATAPQGRLGNFDIQIFRGEPGGLGIQWARGKAPSFLLELDGATRSPAGGGGDTGTHEVGHVVIRLAARTVVAGCDGTTARLGAFGLQELTDALGAADQVQARVRRAKGTEPTVVRDGETFARGTATRVELTC